MDRRDIWRIMQITMEEWNEIQHIGCDSNEHDWLLDLLSENSCYTLEWGIIKIENGEISIYEKQWKHSLNQINVGIWNDIILCVSIKFDMILQTSLTIILSTVIVYCWWLQTLENRIAMNYSEWSRQKQIQKPITIQLIQTLYFQFIDDFHYTTLFYRL